MSISKIESFWSLAHTKNKPNQMQRYVNHGSPDCIKDFIAIGGGSKMGATLERFARFTFTQLKGRKNTGHDHTFKTYKIEQKSSGHWAEEDYKWQHIEANHDWDVLLLCGIDYHSIKFWIMTRKIFQEMLEKGKITNQGNKEKDSSQGVWFNYLDVKEGLVEVQTDAQLEEAITVDE
jgi:hypothetical protein